MKKKLLDEFKRIIGEEHYDLFLKLLKEIGPDSRTHRICVVVVGILRFALSRIADDYEKTSLAEVLIVVDEEPYSDGEEYHILMELIDEICQEAGMGNYRTTSRGVEYSISENTISEYCRWYNMPWEA